VDVRVAILTPQLARIRDGFVERRTLEDRLGSVAASAVLGPALPKVAASLPGTTRTVEAVAAALLVVCMLFAVLLAVAALVARPGWVARPRHLRPWRARGRPEEHRPVRPRAGGCGS
jgi:hypothetical protein